MLPEGEKVGESLRDKGYGGIWGVGAYPTPPYPTLPHPTDADLGRRCVLNP